MKLLPGLAAFVLFVLFDLNKIRHQSRLCGLLFPLGGLLLAASTVWCVEPHRFQWQAVTVFGLLGSVVSAAALIYTLFFALPFHDTYTEAGQEPVVSTGVYGLCRHPGFWPFLTLYACLWLTFRGPWLLAAAVVFPLCNGFYIYIQDRWIFPRYIHGYDEYRRAVPFLIPRRKR